MRSIICLVLVLIVIAIAGIPALVTDPHFWVIASAILWIAHRARAAPGKFVKFHTQLAIDPIKTNTLNK
jgi:hypothetical protein